MSTLTETRETLPTGSWREDPVHSHVGFELGYAGGIFKGSFSPFEARLDVDANGTAVLTGEAHADSVHVLDENLNFQADPGEKRVYFEVSGFSNYVFFENPH